MVIEPTAAALAFAFDNHARQNGSLQGFAEEIAQHEMTAMVYDLGGGTFDVSIVRMSADKFETLATDGDVRLGGRDWDEKLVAFAAEQFQQQHGTDPRDDPGSLAFLYQACENAKYALTVRNSTRILVVHDNKRLPVEVTREQFEQMTSSLLSRTEITTELVLESAQMSWDQIDRILLVGGMTRVPAVRNMIQRISGREPDVSLSADEVVAHGAAIHGGILLARGEIDPTLDVGTLKSWAKFQTVDVNSHSLGIAVRTQGGNYANSILISKNTQLPVSRGRTYRTNVPNQRQVRVRILEGEAREADACAQIGEFLIQNLPPNLPERSPIEVECRYGSDGRISVVGRDLTSGQLAQTTIVRQGGIDEDDLASEAKRLEELPIV